MITRINHRYKGPVETSKLSIQHILDRLEEVKRIRNSVVLKSDEFYTKLINKELTDKLINNKTDDLYNSTI